MIIIGGGLMFLLAQRGIFALMLSSSLEDSEDFCFLALVHPPGIGASDELDDSL